MAELNDERGKKGAGVLLSLVLEIKEKEGYMGGSCIADGLNILDNGRTIGVVNNEGHNQSGTKETNLSTLFPDPATGVEIC